VPEDAGTFRAAQPPTSCQRSICLPEDHRPGRSELRRCQSRRLNCVRGPPGPSLPASAPLRSTDHPPTPQTILAPPPVTDGLHPQSTESNRPTRTTTWKKLGKEPAEAFIERRQSNGTVSCGKPEGGNPSLHDQSWKKKSTDRIQDANRKSSDSNQV